MPRISLRQLRQAYTISPLLSRLLPACRDLTSAQNELRWLQEHATATAKNKSGVQIRRKLAVMCERRRRGVPLQYIIGTQPFGDLDIHCAPGVLIPRPETEAYTAHLAHLLNNRELLGPRDPKQPLRVMDFCTGTGCIPLLLYSVLVKRFPNLTVRGVDISPVALQVSNRNLRSAVSSGHIPPPTSTQTVSFLHGDVLSKHWVDTHLAGSRCDVLVSNPPYVSSQAWNLARDGLSYSARKYEPKLALVPGDDARVPEGRCLHEDVFYAALLDITLVIDPSVVLFEVGGAQQAERVVQLAMEHAFGKNADFELWRDYPDIHSSPDEADDDVGDVLKIRDDPGHNGVVPVRGCGNIRSVLIRKIGSSRV
ncbi:hypothetical protein jhhlp_002561 [Lomentospora prolificans]|uniref:Uncharacterized protein n=1 Tax=Lomentospora prolificans TaxID=41688 RepID=A0A2N3NEE9_9PEZI|nr:hypothetical protein jhhlp_002561 [Lomentospora prolificans]